jgi:UDP-glucose 4-epimerase
VVVGIIGANGFIGRNICSHHISRKDKVYAFVKNNYDKVPKGCEIFLSTQPCNTILDYLYIAIGNYSLPLEHQIIQTQEISKIISNLNFKKIIFISSTSVYGNHNLPIKLNSDYITPNTYGIIKLLQESLIKQFNNYCIIRPTYVYGNGMENNSLISTWIKSATKSQTINVLGNGTRSQDYIHISDLLNILDNIPTENTTILVATGQSISNLELANLICKNLPLTNITHQGIDNSPSFNFETDYLTPLKDIQQGIKELIEYEVSNL